MNLHFQQGFCHFFPDLASDSIVVPSPRRHKTDRGFSLGPKGFLFATFPVVSRCLRGGWHRGVWKKHNLYTRLPNRESHSVSQRAAASDGSTAVPPGGLSMMSCTVRAFSLPNPPSTPFVLESVCAPGPTNPGPATAPCD